MRRLIIVPFLLLSAVVASINFPASSALIESSKSRKESSFGAALRENNQKSLWESLFGKKKKPKPSRGDFCSIWPNRNDKELLKIWNIRPVFVWEGTVKRIAVHPAASDQVLWSYDVKPNEQSILYNGPTLEPGQGYDYWVTFEYFTNGVPSEKTDRISFEIMGEPERSRIATELAAIKRQSPFLSHEELAEKHADYFHTQGLWSDVFREFFSIQNSSKSWKSMVERIRTQQCPRN